MTEKLFWIDPYQKEFTAAVVQQFPVQDGHAVVLDRTCFYATSGGQPYDVGTLNSTEVRDVRFQDDHLIHVVATPIESSAVQGRIDWDRRFNHMQQHTGQHILSAAFFQLFQAETSSFHLGEEYCSIELNKPSLNRDQVRKAEELANKIIFGAKPIQSFFIDPEKARDYPLRKKSDLQESLRIVQIGDFDLSPCSGTHVQNSGEVGAVFITGTEKLSQTIKVSFLCGQRVLTQYHKDLDILKSLSKSLTTSPELLVESISKLQEQSKELRRELTQLKEGAWKQEAAQLYEAAENRKDLRIVLQTWKRPYQEVRFIAQKLLEFPSVAGAVVSVPDKRAIFFKHSQVPLDLRPVFQKFLQAFSAKGGGPAHQMEAGGFEVTQDFEQRLRNIWEEHI